MAWPIERLHKLASLASREETGAEGGIQMLKPGVAGQSGGNIAVEIVNNAAEYFRLTDQAMFGALISRRLQRVERRSPNAMPASLRERPQFRNKQCCGKAESDREKESAAGRYIGGRQMKRAQYADEIMSMQHRALQVLES